jgi:hypothetical protein
VYCQDIAMPDLSSPCAQQLLLRRCVEIAQQLLRGSSVVAAVIQATAEELAAALIKHPLFKEVLAAENGVTPDKLKPERSEQGGEHADPLHCCKAALLHCCRTSGPLTLGSRRIECVGLNGSVLHLCTGCRDAVPIRHGHIADSGTVVRGVACAKPVPVLLVLCLLSDVARSP